MANRRKLIQLTLILVGFLIIFFTYFSNLEKKQVIYHQPSNYFVMDMQQYKAILDIAEIGANYNPGHAHADTLSFELSIGGNRAIRKPTEPRTK